jgi:hypothetical protein
MIDTIFAVIDWKEKGSDFNTWFMTANAIFIIFMLVYSVKQMYDRYHYQQLNHG